MSAIPEMTPSKMFLAARSVPPGNVWTFTFPLVRIETSFAQRSICTQGKVAEGAKLAYRSVIGSAACAVPDATDNARTRTDRRTGIADFAFTSASLGNGLGNFPHRPGENCPIVPESARRGQSGFWRPGPGDGVLSFQCAHQLLPRFAQHLLVPPDVRRLGPVEEPHRAAAAVRQQVADLRPGAQVHAPAA